MEVGSPRMKHRLPGASYIHSNLTPIGIYPLSRTPRPNPGPEARHTVLYAVESRKQDAGRRLQEDHPQPLDHYCEDRR